MAEATSPTNEENNRNSDQAEKTVVKSAEMETAQMQHTGQLILSRPVAQLTCVEEDSVGGPLVVSLTEIVEKIKNYKNRHRVFPALIILGGLANSGKSKFLKHLQYYQDPSNPPNVHDDASFSQSLIISNGFKLLFRQQYRKTSVAVRDSETSLFYCLISGIHNVFNSTKVTVTSATNEELQISKYFENSKLQKGITSFYSRKERYQKVQSTTTLNQQPIGDAERNIDVSEQPEQNVASKDVSNSAVTGHQLAKNAESVSNGGKKSIASEQPEQGAALNNNSSAIITGHQQPLNNGKISTAVASDQPPQQNANVPSGYEKELEQKMWKALNALEANIHNGISVSRLWELTINRTSLRFLECFRRHLYNSHIWLFMNIDRDLDHLFEPPEPRPDGVHPHAMQWRSRLHYLLRSCCLADACDPETKRGKVCRIIVMYKEEKDLQKKIERFKEEAEIAAAQYGFSDMIDFSEIITVKEEQNEETAKNQAYNIFSSYLRSLPVGEVPLSWTFLRLVLELYDESAVFIEHSTKTEIAKQISEHFNVEEFLKYYTSFGDILDVKLVNANSKWVILQPDVFLKTLCQNLLSKYTSKVASVKHGIITEDGVTMLFEKDGQKYFDVLNSLGLVTKMKASQLSPEMKEECNISLDETTVYFMSIIRQDIPDTDNKENAVQLICGLKSAEMNMQVSFTRELQSHFKPVGVDVLLGPCLKVNRTHLEIICNSKMVAEIEFVVQGDIIEIRLNKHSQEDIDTVCEGVLLAIQKICEKRAKRGGTFDYHFRTLCIPSSRENAAARQPINHQESDLSDADENVLTNFGRYRILETAGCATSAERRLSVPLSFEKALQHMATEGSIKYYKSPEKSIMTADLIYSLAKEVKDKQDVEVLAQVLDVVDCPTEGHSPIYFGHIETANSSLCYAIEDDDPIWFMAFEILLAWRKQNKESNNQSKYNLALALIRRAKDFKSNRVLKSLVRKLDTQMYFKALKALSESEQRSDGYVTQDFSQSSTTESSEVVVSKLKPTVDEHHSGSTQ